MTAPDLPLPISPWRLCVAPMMDWTDRHCRYFHRLITRGTRLYTEMVTTGALLHGDVARHLDFDADEHPVALQLGGSEPADLAACARLGERWGYDEINLNCGCPSERVQRGAFGACLMAEPQLVADCVKAMRDAVDRAGDGQAPHRHRPRSRATASCATSSARVAEAGCEVFIVHARNAWLKGLSPKENREMPPLRYDFVHRLKREFPQLTIVLNGGVADEAEHRRATAARRRRDDRPRGLSRAVVDGRLGSRLSSAGAKPRRRARRSRRAGSSTSTGSPPPACRGRARCAHRSACGTACPARVCGARRWSDHRLQHEPPRRVAALAGEALHALAPA